MKRKLIMEFEVVPEGDHPNCEGCFFDDTGACPEADCEGYVFKKIDERIEETGEDQG